MQNPKPDAKAAPHHYRRNLPPYQGVGGPVFVTFSTKHRWVLPESVRSKVLEHCRFDHGGKIHLHCAVVMPDHVHLVYQPLMDENHNIYGLEEIVGSIKSVSAHSINKMLGRKGAVWEPESFDHVLRSSESLEKKILYVQRNPVRKGLVSTWNDYPWMWFAEED